MQASTSTTSHISPIPLPGQIWPFSFFHHSVSPSLSGGKDAGGFEVGEVEGGTSISSSSFGISSADVEGASFIGLELTLIDFIIDVRQEIYLGICRWVFVGVGCWIDWLIGRWVGLRGICQIFLNIWHKICDYCHSNQNYDCEKY